MWLREHRGSRRATWLLTTGLFAMIGLSACEGGGGGEGGSGGASSGGGAGGGGTAAVGGGTTTAETTTSTPSGQGGAGGAACAETCGEDAHCEAGACVCDAGYSGDGQTCLDVNECAETPELCHPSADCTNTTGSYECACPSGTIGEPEPSGVGCSARYVAAASGTYHTCLVRMDDAVVCFGNGGSGRLGNGATTHQSKPVQAGAAFNWARIAPGGSHTCGLKTTNNAWCFGANNFGQLGLGHTDAQSLPAYVSLDRQWTDIATGDNHACAVEDDGTLSCWGRNNVGQLGTGSASTTETSPVHVSVDPMAASPDNDWKAIAAGRDNTCAQKASGLLYCWGQNSNLQAGKTGGGTVATPYLVETVAGSMDSDWAQISTGTTTCATKNDKSLWCWGRNAEGQLGDGTTTQTASPKQVMPGVLWKKVRVGVTHVCAIQDAGTLFCWGRNQTAQVQAGAPGRILAPTQVGSDNDWEDVAPGLPHTCGIKKDGRVLCWGARPFGNTAEAALAHETKPVQIGAEAGWSQLSAYGENMTAKNPAGERRVWGNNELGQFGNGLTASEQSPLAAAGAPSFKELAFGRLHACGITDTGVLQCSGSNANGGLASGNTTSTLMFAPIQSAGKPWEGLTWKTLAVSELSGCAIASDDSLWCWGYNCYGQVDAASATTSITSLVQVLPATPKNWVSVAAGQFHICATRADTSLHCWGRNLNGQVGNGTVVASEASCANKTGPFSHGTGWKHSVSAGVNHTCAIKTNGTLWCWGNNASSQIGDNTTTERTSPVQVGSDTDWEEVKSANQFTCARKTSGALYCWGANGTGQLGVGDLGTRKVPTQVGSDSWSEVALGFAHSCGLRADNTLWCWGSGEYGQNGLGKSWSLVPTAIVEMQ